MSKRSERTFTRLMDYLEWRWPRVADLFRATCAEYALVPRGVNGITLLIPSDDIIDIVEEKARGYEEEYNIAYDLLTRLVLRDYFPTAAEFYAKSEDIPNSQKVPQRVKLAPIRAGNMVNFDNGATAIPDPDFHAGTKNLAVWILTGEIPSGTGDASGKFNAKRAKSKDAPAQSQGSNDMVMRWIKSVEAAALTASDRRSFLMTYRKPVGHFLGWLNKYHSDYYYAIVPLLNHTCFDFYLLFAEGIVPASTVYLWLQSPDRQKFTAGNLDAGGAAAPPCAFYNSKPALIRAIAQLRADICRQPSRDIVENIKGMIMKLAMENKVANCDNVLPAITHRYYADYPFKAIIHHELRYISYFEYDGISKAPLRNRERIQQLNKTIADLISATSLQTAPLGVLNDSRVRYAVDPKNIIEFLLLFAKSSFGPVYVRLTSDDIGQIKHSTTASSQVTTGNMCFIPDAIIRGEDPVMKVNSKVRLDDILADESIPEEARSRLREKYSSGN